MKRDTHFYEFGDFRLDSVERFLYRNGEPVKLSPKAFDLLFVLVRNNGQIIEKNELMRQVWADAFVEEANLTVHIAALRKILGSGTGGSIETFPKRGYRFNGEVKQISLENERATTVFNSEAQSQTKVEDLNNSRQTNVSITDSTEPTYIQVSQPNSFSNAPTATDLPQNAAKTGRQNRYRIIAIVPIIIFIALCGSGYALYKLFNPRSSFETMKITRVLDTGKTVEAAISPDGKYIAHIVREPGKQSLWVKQIAANSSVQLVAPAAVGFSPLTFSNDSSYIYYVLRQNNSPGVLYQIPVLGGEPRKILENVAGAISFVPEGERFVFVRNISPDETALIIANLNGVEERQLAARRKPESFHSSGVGWSPDGKFIACSNSTTSGERNSNIAIIWVADGTERQLSNRKWQFVERIAWLKDGSGLVAPAIEFNKQETGQIWFFSFPDGEARRITNDLNDYGGVSLTADSKTLVTIQFEIRRKIWLVPNVETMEAKSLTDDMNDSYRFVGWTPDKKIVYVASGGGSRDIWLMNADGSNRKQLTSTEHQDILPSACGSGRFVVFASNRTASGAMNVWRINLDGTNAVQLTHGVDETLPNCTPDGQWVFYVSGGNDSQPEKRAIWKVPIDGGEPVQIAANPSYGADISPDGKQFVCWYKSDNSAPWKAAIISIEGGEPTKFLDIPPGSPLRWTPDGSAITFVKTQNGVSNIWSQPLNGEQPKQLTDFTAEQILFFDWSSDNQLVCSRGVTIQEAVLISDFR